MIIIGCSGSVDVARSIAKKAGKRFVKLDVRRFPDHEMFLKFPGSVSVRGKSVVLVQSLDHPSGKIIEVLFAAHTAKDLGAKKVILVAPYLAYMRQDKRFHYGECVSARVMGKLFSVFDAVITIDPHLHRIHNLADIFRHGTKLSANYLIGNYVKKHFKRNIIIGPDEESYQWARLVAKHIKSHAIVLKKKRWSAKKVRIKIKENIDLSKEDVVIIDDIISTGHTMIETVKEAKRLKAKRVYCMCVHGILADNAYQKLKKAGAAGIISTNTVKNKTNRIDVSGIIAKELEKAKYK